MQLFVYGEPRSWYSGTDVSQCDWVNAANRQLFMLDDDSLGPQVEDFLPVLSPVMSRNPLDYYVGLNQTGLWYVLRRAKDNVIVAGMFNKEISPIPPVFTLDFSDICIHTLMSEGSES